jgi:hypothetical protein
MPTFRPPSESSNSTETGNNTDEEFRDFSDNEEVPHTEETQQLTIDTPIIALKLQLTQPQSSAQAQTPTQPQTPAQTLPQQNIMATVAPKPNKMKIRLPSNFNGDCTKTREFILDCSMYLNINDAIYNTDKKKILFALSYMRGGTAGPWKDAFYTAKHTANRWGTFADLETELMMAFSPSDKKGDARAKLKTLRMKGGMTADEYIAEFRTAKAQSGINKDAALIEYFMEGIPIPLMEKINTLNNVPTMLDDWMKFASRFDNSYRCTKAITARLRGNTGQPGKKKYNF